jgi:hypothetical protein
MKVEAGCKYTVHFSILFSTTETGPEKGFPLLSSKLAFAWLYRLTRFTGQFGASQSLSGVIQ